MSTMQVSDEELKAAEEAADISGLNLERVPADSPEGLKLSKAVKPRRGFCPAGVMFRTRLMVLLTR